MTRTPLKLVSDPVGADMTVRDQAREFAQKYIAPNAETWERERTYPREAIQAGCELFGGFLVAKELGGKGGSVTDFLYMVEEFAKEDVAFTLSFVVHHHTGFMISLSQNEALRDRLLPDLMSANRIGAFVLTEPGAGSDAAGISTLASPDGNGVTLNGQKAWITASTSCDDMVLFAKTEENGGPKTIACYAVDVHDGGVVNREPFDMIGGHCTRTGSFELKDAKVPAENTLFPAGDAFPAAMACLDAARLGIGAMCTGALTSALETSLDYARNRRMFGGTTIQNQGIQWGYAEHVTNLEASRAMMFQTAKLAEASQSISLSAAHTKKFATQAAFEGINWSARAMGANGNRRDCMIPRQFAMVQHMFNADGTNDIMNVVIGRGLAK